jgi:hypothetical protein
MYVRVREGSRQVQSSYIFSPHFGSYLGELGQRETLLEQLRKASNNKQIFDILRQQPRFPLDTAVITALRSRFIQGSDALWLAETLARRGPEPLWLGDEIKERVQRVKSLGPDPGNYQATLQDPNPGGALTGALAGCTDSLKDTQLPKAFFFPGRDPRRALIISGVHGNEKNGVQVVQSLQTLLAARSVAGDKPFFSTILVPIVILRTQAGAGQRDVPGGMGKNNAGAVECREVEPNRNFPLPGEDLKKARNRGATGRTEPELVIRDRCRGTIRAPIGEKKTSIRMLPETRILISLIERFQPERLASVHDHTLEQHCHSGFGRDTLYGGEGPGIFVDPRGISPETGKITDLAQVQADDQLARRMVEKALRELTGVARVTSPFPPFAGNQALTPLTSRYFSEQRVEGNSLGDWAPVPATGTRLGITTLTIELPRSGFVSSTAKNNLINLHRDLLKDIFLES